VAHDPREADEAVRRVAADIAAKLYVTGCLGGKYAPIDHVANAFPAVPGPTFRAAVELLYRKGYAQPMKHHACISLAPSVAAEARAWAIAHASPHRSRRLQATAVAPTTPSVDGAIDAPVEVQADVVDLLEDYLPTSRHESAMVEVHRRLGALEAAAGAPRADGDVLRRLERLEQRVAGLHRRMDDLAGRLDSLPKGADLTKLRDMIRRHGQVISRMQGERPEAVEVGAEDVVPRDGDVCIHDCSEAVVARAPLLTWGRGAWARPAGAPSLPLCEAHLATTILHVRRGDLSALREMLRTLHPALGRFLVVGEGSRRLAGEINRRWSGQARAQPVPEAVRQALDQPVSPPPPGGAPGEARIDVPGTPG
jgi:hypothetical protein